MGGRDEPPVVNDRGPAELLAARGLERRGEGQLRRRFHRHSSHDLLELQGRAEAAQSALHPGN